MISLERFKQAQEVLKDVILKTDLIKSPYYSEITNNNVFLKPENMQLAGAYKIRGAYFKVFNLTKEQKESGLVTSSAGNHAQGVAYTAQKFKIKSTIVMPVNTPFIKIANTKAYGADVVLEGNYFDEAFSHAKKLSNEKGYTFVHAFNDLDVATGQGTVGLEIIQKLPEVDIILVPVGGGGLIAGISTLMKYINPNVKVIGVEPVGACSLYESLKVGKAVPLPKVSTIADGVAVQTPGDIIFPYIQKNVDEIIKIEDEELLEPFIDLIEKHKMIAESSGLLTLAALKHLKVKNKNIVAILSGGNIDSLAIANMLNHALFKRNRLFIFKTKIKDKSGELSKIVNIIENKKATIKKISHNHCVDINKSIAIEVKVVVEAFGVEHKKEIFENLESEGYKPFECSYKEEY